MRKIIIIIFAIIWTYGKSNAQKPVIIISDKTGWHKIAEQKVNFTLDKDEIIVLVSDRFSGIKLKIKDADIDLNNIEMYFEAGDNQIVEINRQIKANTESEPIKINGGERELKKIVFRYKTLSNKKNKNAKVEIWGLKLNTEKYD
jgi:hypothetical protein